MNGSAMLSYAEHWWRHGVFTFQHITSSFCGIKHPSSSILTCGHWSANNTDLNPVNYHIRGMMQEHAYQANKLTNKLYATTAWLISGEKTGCMCRPRWHHFNSSYDAACL